MASELDFKITLSSLWAAAKGEQNNDILHKYWDFFTTYSRDKATLDVHRLENIRCYSSFLSSDYIRHYLELFGQEIGIIWHFLDCL